MEAFLLKIQIKLCFFWGEGKHFGKQSGRHRLKNPPDNICIYIYTCFPTPQQPPNSAALKHVATEGVRPTQLDSPGQSGLTLDAYCKTGKAMATAGKPRAIADAAPRRRRLWLQVLVLKLWLHGFKSKHLIGSMELCYRPWRRSSVHLLWFSNLIDGSKSWKPFCICCKSW